MQLLTDVSYLRYFKISVCVISKIYQIVAFVANTVREYFFDSQTLQCRLPSGARCLHTTVESTDGPNEGPPIPHLAAHKHTAASRSWFYPGGGEGGCCTHASSGALTIFNPLNTFTTPISKAFVRFVLILKVYLFLEVTAFLRQLLLCLSEILVTNTF